MNAAVLVGALTTASTLDPRPGPSVATATPAAAPVRDVDLPPPPVTLAVQAPAPPLPAFDAGDPATWPSRRLAAQLVFSCVHTSQLDRGVAQAAAGIGGIVLLGSPRDGAALARAVAAMRQAGPDGVQPMLASDEEGGLVQRLAHVLGRLPSPAEMSAWPDARLEQTAAQYGAGMRGLGLSMALAPVADLSVPGFYPHATRRAFSPDPHRTAAAVAAWARGLEQAGLASAVKHWPGHGHAVDSHGQPSAAPPFAVLQGRDLVPFDAALQNGVDAVMVGHLTSEGLTEPGLPATLSPNALRVLRERVGPATVVLTDSMSMHAASGAVGIRPADAVVRSLQAGADWAMSCVDPLLAVDAVAAALDTGALHRDAAVAAARRVLALKQRHGLLAAPVATAPPTGTLSTAVLRDRLLHLAGTASDPDTAGHPRVQVLVDGNLVSDSQVGPAGEFAVTLPTAPGQQVCVQAMNTGPGRGAPLGCVTTPAEAN